MAHFTSAMTARAAFGAGPTPGSETEKPGFQNGSLIGPMTGDAMNTTLSKENTTLGVIGLGLMGSRFLRRLNAEGWNVRGWNRNEKVTLALREYGVQIETALAELVDGSEVLISSLADDSAVEAVYLGEDGVFAHVR